MFMTPAGVGPLKAGLIFCWALLLKNDGSKDKLLAGCWLLLFWLSCGEPFRSSLRFSLRDRRGDRSRDRLRSLRLLSRLSRLRLRLRSRRRLSRDLSRDRDRSRRSFLRSFLSRSLDLERVWRRSLLSFFGFSSSLISSALVGVVFGVVMIGGSITAGWGTSSGLPMPGIVRPGRPLELRAGAKGVKGAAVCVGATTGAATGAAAGVACRLMRGTLCLAASITLCISERELSSSFTCISFSLPPSSIIACRASSSVLQQ